MKTCLESLAIKTCDCNKTGLPLHVGYHESLWLGSRPEKAGGEANWLGGRGASVLGLFNNALVNSSGTEMQCSEKLCYPLEPTALNLRAVA